MQALNKDIKVYVNKQKPGMISPGWLGRGKDKMPLLQYPGGIAANPLSGAFSLKQIPFKSF